MLFFELGKRRVQIGQELIRCRPGGGPCNKLKPKSTIDSAPFVSLNVCSYFTVFFAVNLRLYQ